MSNPLPTTEKPEDQIDLLQLFSVLWRGKWIMAACALLALFVGAYQAYIAAVPLYPARTTIALEGEQQQVIADIETIFAGGGTDIAAINTEFQVIRSRRLIGALVDELDLVSDPEFNGALRPVGLRSRVTNFILGRDPAPSLPPEIARRSVIDAVIGRITVSGIRQSLVFVIGVETTDPNKSTLIVNTLAALYIEDQIQQKLDAATQAIDFLSRRTTELEENVETLSQQLALAMEQSNAVSPELLQANNQRLRELRERMSELEGRIADDETEIARLSETDDLDLLLAQMQDSENPRIFATLQRFQANRLSEDELLTAVSETVAQLQQTADRARDQLSALQVSEAELASSVRTQSDELIALDQLEREVQAAQLLYETFLTRLQEASVQQGLETANARILSEAVPRRASSPRKQLILAVSVMVGLVIGAGLVILREMRFVGFRTADDLRNETQVRVLGSIPDLGTRTRKDSLAAMKAKSNSVFGEAVRNLRTSLLMSSIDREPQVILLTSSVPGEGKTTLSIALARYFASLEGKRVLLMEADMRRNTLKNYYDSPPEVTLVDLLLGRVPAGEVDFKNEELGVELLVGSDLGVNAADLFASQRFKELLEVLRGEFDYIVIDSPPVLAVPDARVLAKYADCIAFVVHWASTSKTQVRQGLEMITSVGATVDGTVLTQIDQKKMKAYGYGGQYGYDTYSSGYYG